MLGMHMVNEYIKYNVVDVKKVIINVNDVMFNNALHTSSNAY